MPGPTPPIVLPRELNPPHLATWAFDLPFPRPVPHPEHDRAVTDARTWVQRMGIVTTDEELRRHDRMALASWPGLNFPNATGADLDLLCNWVCWWVVMDDRDDGEFIQDPRRVEEFYRRLIAVVAPDRQSGHPDLGADPMVEAFADIWRRWRQGMSPGWQARTAENWAKLFEALIDECAGRRDGAVPSMDQYLAIRDRSGEMALELDATERVGHYEVPQAVLDTPALASMRLSTIRAVNISQDVQSLAKEEAIGDNLNMVLVLERERSLGRVDALCEVHRMIRVYTDDFLAHQATVPRVLDGLGLAPEDRLPVYRHIDDLGRLIVGNLVWCAAAERYRT
ncbi:hypothetical protein AB0K51_22890 [Kitasatospora sp. NPDC049285]|uniref:terpene synthase family protein n=1 Tax=Kitasatospora sp. NPDC049285 TaxID=3157096 RepID=UPI00343B38F1